MKIKSFCTHTQKYNSNIEGQPQTAKIFSTYFKRVFNSLYKELFHVNKEKHKISTEKCAKHKPGQLTKKT